MIKRVRFVGGRKKKNNTMYTYTEHAGRQSEKDVEIDKK